MLLAGVDGCRAGWLSATLDLETGEVRGAVFPDASTLFERQRAIITAIDIPIGLPASRERSCDREARRLVGPRASSVFPAPVRATLAAETYEAACLIAVQASGKRLSKQTYAILPKIREVDAAVRSQPIRVYEVHPEVSFCIWNGGTPMSHPKRSGFGFLERYRLVQQVFGRAADCLRDALPRRGVSDDDILDALAALWTAKRIHAGSMRRIAADEEHDECGLLMQIFA